MDEEGKIFFFLVSIGRYFKLDDDGVEAFLFFGGVSGIPQASRGTRPGN